MEKSHLEMQLVDLRIGWQQLAGFAAGLEVKMLADNLDQQAKTGARTRLVRIGAGVVTGPAPLIHDYWEEVFLLSGDLRPVASTNGGPVGHTYSCRPPGTPHGPFRSDGGCVLLETQYYPQ